MSFIQDIEASHGSHLPEKISKHLRSHPQTDTCTHTHVLAEAIIVGKKTNYTGKTEKLACFISCGPSVCLERLPYETSTFCPKTLAIERFL